MSAFKDAILSDVKDVFLNFDEFGSYHLLNNVRTLCIIDKDISQELIRSRMNLEGIFANEITLYVASKDIEEKPVEGQLIRIDRSFHMIKSVSDEDGIFAIVCEENKQ